MKRIAIVLCLAPLACGGDPPPPAQPAPDYMAQARAQQQAQVDADQQRIRAMTQQATDNARAQQQAQQERLEAMRAQAQKAEADRAAAVAQAQADRAAQAEQECTVSRPRRAAEAQANAQLWKDFLARGLPAMKRVTAICKIQDTTGVRVEHQSDSRGTTYRVRNVGAVDDLVCSAPLPRGISKDDAHTILTFDQYKDTPVTADSRDDSLNQRCAASDNAVGLNTQATYGDGVALRGLLQWGKTADAGAP